MQNDMVTIVVPVYKIEESYLRLCIDSIMKQTSDRWKLILVDDGSPDNCGKICDEYDNGSNIRVIHQENQGVSVARNTGIDAADTKWITFVDPDDWIEPTEIETVLLAADKNDADIFAFGYTREFKDHSQLDHLQDESGMVSDELLEIIRIAPLHRFTVNNHIKSYSVNAIWNKVYRLDFLKKNNIYFEPAARKGQDRIFNLYALDLTDKIYYIKECFYHYRNDNESSTVNRYNTQTVQNAEITFELMRNWIHRKKRSEKYDKMLNCRICVRFYEYMRLYFFNEQNPNNRKTVNKEIKELLAREPYASAMKNLDYSILSSTEKVFIAFLRMHQFGMCRILMKLKSRK